MSQRHWYACSKCGGRQSVVDPKPGPLGPGPGFCLCGASPAYLMPVFVVAVGSASDREGEGVAVYDFDNV